MNRLTGVLVLSSYLPSVSAMVRGIYWPYEVAIAMEKKNEKERMTSGESIV